MIWTIAKKELRGTATLSVERSPNAVGKTPLVLDTRDLTIEGVSAGADDATLAEVPWKLGAADKILGAPLTITPPVTAKLVRVTYKTSPKATALQWVEPSGTANKKRPFLFTQSEAIHARTWVPIQDTPHVRMTYSAAIRVPSLTIVAVRKAMSAGALNSPAARCAGRSCSIRTRTDASATSRRSPTRRTPRVPCSSRPPTCSR